MHRWIAFPATALVMGAAFTMGVWLGEDGSALSRSLRWLGFDAILAGGIVMWLTKDCRRQLRGVAALASIAAAAIGFFAGDHDATRAYSDCVEHAEQIRSELRSYQQREGRFPARLADAVRRDHLCLHPLRGSLLWYSATDHSYELEFGDSLVTWHATDRDAFIATK